jgi:hypothetical protein
MKPKPAGRDASRACRACLYWRIGLIVTVAALLTAWITRALGN